MKFLINIILIFAALQFSFAQDVEDIIEDVQERYDEIEDISATFKRIESFKLTGTVSETVGKIYIKDGVKYRFESDDQSIATDGKTVWTYNSISKQFIIDNVRKNSGALLPRDMLFKYPKEYYSTLLGEAEVDGKDVFIIKLDPRENVHGFVKSMKIWVEDDEWLIRRIEITDLTDNKSTYEISKILIDEDLKDDFFVLQASDEMNVVDMR
ncbi:MAG: outer membrane lipoprotein carrier protein LolA [Calditrichaeota bacterium]|nr:MAG: outer membrane lipoprotein carrier protein LolA [Calditrichota bacterium]MBL1207701.1 outer membrane lipoprotein carrier protein LolA [Calditrichota bacterium]NOG47536.1 outer membrane lipoprotein carrier protein LolA [Calditrichota bacterium]